MTDVFYLASPYSLYPAGPAAAYRMACRETAVLIKAGFAIYSPITHSHAITIYSDLKGEDWQLWMGQCRAMLPRLTGLIALKAPSWSTSRGMNEEIATMEELGKPVFFMRMGEVPPDLVKFAAKRAAANV